MSKPAHELHIDLDEDAPAEQTPADTIVDEDAPIGASAAEDPDVVDEDADLDPADRLPKHAVRNADGSVTLPLHYPQVIKTKKNGKVRERRFESLTFYRLTGADQIAISSTSEESIVPVSFARSTRLSTALMQALHSKMDMADIQAAGQVLNHFLSTGPRTGRRSSAG